MNKWAMVLLVLAAAVPSPAETNAPVRLAVVSETDEAMTAADVLTAQFSSNDKIQLLERDQIEKVYREQGMSEANRDDLKIGRILGADGLLLLNVVRTPQVTNLTARLVAVKPGVVLTDGSFPWPLKDTSQWAESVATYLNSFLPKLTVLAKDAIPISIVNLRAAVSSADEQETERDLKVLTIQRLSQERQFFVLERQKMQLLNQEKELKSDESAFWDGSYLLDGIVDQNGYAKDTITINARLTPPKGGAPLSFEVSGGRTNLSEVVNRLAAKVTELLNVSSTVPEWSAANEAAQYFDEAKWALRWGVYPEAQAAAESAWALGKKDLDCASARVRAYIGEIPAVLVPNGDWYQNGRRAYYVHVNEAPDPYDIDRASYALKIYIEFTKASSDGESMIISRDGHNSDWYQLGIDTLIAASQVLQHYYFNPQLQPSVADKLADLRALTRSVGELISQSPSVYDSYFVGGRVATHDELAHTIQENPNIFRCKLNWGCFWQENPEDCVALYRQLMSSPVFSYIHEGLWDREALQPRLIAWNRNDDKRISAVWGNFVQELNDSTNVFCRLEAKALVFAYAVDGPKMAIAFTNLMNSILGNHDALVTNNVEVLYSDWGIDRLVEVKTSSDEGYEGKSSDELAAYIRLKESLDRLFDSEYRPKLMAMDEEYWDKTVPALKFAPQFAKQVQFLKAQAPYDFFKFAELFNERNYSTNQAVVILPLVAVYRSNLIAQSEGKAGMERAQTLNAIYFVGDLEQYVIRILNPPPKFAEQKEYLKVQTPFNFFQFTELFNSRNYSTNQAKEILPLILSYESNLIAQAAGETGVERKRSQEAIVSVRRVENDVHRILNSRSKLNPPSKPNTITTGTVERQSPAMNPFEPPSEKATNVLLVSRFLKIPCDRLQGNDVSGVQIFAQRRSEGKLLIDLKYGVTIYEFDTNGNWKGTAGGVPESAIAIFDPKGENWDIINDPDDDFQDFQRSAQMTEFSFHDNILFRGDLFLCEDDLIKKFDFNKREWQTLPIPQQEADRLFDVGGNLFIVGGNSISELTDDAKGIRILASTRRRPAASALDLLDSLGSPMLFAGPNGLLRASIGSKIYSWNGKDWQEIFDFGFAPQKEFSEDGVLFRNGVEFFPYDPPGLQDKHYHAETLWLLQRDQSRPELCLYEKSRQKPWDNRQMPVEQTAHPLWQSIEDEPLVSSGGTVFKSDLYFFVDHCIVTNLSGHWAVAEKDGYHAQLVCLSRGYPDPIIVPLKFDLASGQAPLKSLADKMQPFSDDGPQLTWLHFCGDMLYIGQQQTLGVWAIPISEVESAVAAQKQIQVARKAKEERQALAAEEERRKALERQHQDLLAKYDLNHNGRIDPEERQAAWDDPVFIESELDVIDANHNDRLDPEELAYFDANHNKILEPKEQTGIDVAEHLFAERLMKKFDANGDSVLDRDEFENLCQSCGFGRAPGGFPSLLEFSDTDEDHNGQVDLNELESFLKQQLRRQLHPRGAAGAVFFRQQMALPSATPDPQRMFKTYVEFYWQHPDNYTGERQPRSPNDHNR